MKVKVRPKTRGVFAERVREIGKIRGMNQREIADKTGISVVTVSRYFCGERVPKLNDLVKIADALNVSLDTLAGRKSGPELLAVLEAAKKSDEAAMEKEKAYRDAKDKFF